MEVSNMVETFETVTVITGGSGVGKSRYLFEKIGEEMETQSDNPQEKPQGIFFFDDYSLDYAKEHMTTSLGDKKVNNLIVKYTNSLSDIEWGISRIEDYLKEAEEFKVFIDVHNKELNQAILSGVYKLSEQHPNVKVKLFLTKQLERNNAQQELEILKGEMVIGDNTVLIVAKD